MLKISRMGLKRIQGMIARNRVATQANEMLLAINLARSEATRMGSSVSIQAVDGSDTETGWCVVRGNPGDSETAMLPSGFFNHWLEMPQ